MAPKKIAALTMSLALATAPNLAASKDFPIGGGITIVLGDAWSGASMENPAMRFPGMKDMMEEATETRLHGKGSGVLISYMRFKVAKPAQDSSFDDSANNIKAAKFAYADKAVETEFVPTVRRDGDTIRTFITLHAKPGAKFQVGAGYSGGCVTTGSIRKGAGVHSISIASDSCESASHAEAVAAIFG